jgi:hypothetical protein
MSSLFKPLWLNGWFVSVVGTEEDRVSLKCEMFMRDWDFETGEPDILMADPTQDGCCVCGGEPGTYPLENSKRPCPGGCGNQLSIKLASKYHAVFELREEGPAMILDQHLPPSWGYKDMGAEMAAAVAVLITPANFPAEADQMRQLALQRQADELTSLAAVLAMANPMDAVSRRLEEQRLAREAAWTEAMRQTDNLRMFGDVWGALRVQRQAVDALIGWVDPPPDEELQHTIPEPNIEEVSAPYEPVTTPPRATSPQPPLAPRKRARGEIN